MAKRPITKLLFESPSVISGQEVEVSRKDFEFERRLGDGAFGQVWRVKNKHSLKTYAMKQVPKEKVAKMLGQFRREVYIMYELSHPHIIKLFNHFEDEKFFYLIMELADGGNLFHKLYREKCFLERNAAQYFREVVLAVEYLHSHVPAIIHRDIKPENILLDKDGRIKLTDFGWSNYYSVDNPTLRFTMCGTLEYLPPEIVTETGHNTGADVWCLGILLFEMLTGSTPFASKGKDQMLMNITNTKAKFPHSMPPLAKDLISKMIEKEPSKRISAKEIKVHAWLMDHPPIRETITQECLPKPLPSLEEINKVTQGYVKKEIPKEPYKEPEILVEMPDSPLYGDIEQSTNEDNSKKDAKYKANEFRVSVIKLKQQVVGKSEDNTKIKGSIIDLQSKAAESLNRLKALEEKLAEKKKEVNASTGLEKELLSKISDCNIELERMNSINLSQITEKINEKNSELLTKSTQVKQLKAKHESLKANSLKIVQEFNEKEKALAQLVVIMKKTKEKWLQSNTGKKSEISELVTNAEVLKSRLNGHEHQVIKLGRQETSAANDIMRLIREEIQKIGTLLRPNLEKQYNYLQERVSEKEQELAEAKIYFEEQRSAILQSSRTKKDEFVRSLKKKNEISKLGYLTKADESTTSLKSLLNTARKEENKYYIDVFDIGKAKEQIKVLQKQFDESFTRMAMIREEREKSLEIIKKNKCDIEKIEMDIGLIKVQILQYD